MRRKHGPGLFSGSCASAVTATRNASCGRRSLTGFIGAKASPLVVLYLRECSVPVENRAPWKTSVKRPPKSKMAASFTYM